LLIGLEIRSNRHTERGKAKGNQGCCWDCQDCPEAWR
jgi:hypothetical protein